MRSSSSLPRGDRLAVPIVDIDRCTACGKCVEVCPTRAITLMAGAHGEPDLVVDGESCTYCTWCEAACPTGAIECPFEIIG